MTLPDLQSLSDAGGWVVAVAVMIALVGLIVHGDLITKRSHDEAMATVQARFAVLDDLLAKVSGTLGQMASAQQEQTGYLRFMVDFVRTVISERTAHTTVDATRRRAARPRRDG